MLDELNHRRLFGVRDNRHSHPTGALLASFHGHQRNGGLSPFELPTASQTGCGPPIQVSSISTSPYSGSRVALTIARRSLCRILVRLNTVPAVNDD